ncbi:Adenosine monophosphate-protein transferase VbhT [compost metagenome]
MINKRGYQTIEELSKFERAETAYRAFELELKPLKGRFDYEHLKIIHKYLFQNVYEWAGTPRTTTITKGGFVFCPHQDLERHAHYAFSQLQRDNFLKSKDLNEFVEKTAKHYNEINYGHYFREGNGRSGRMFFSQMAKEAGYDIQWERMDVERYYRAVVQAAKTDRLDELKQLFRDYTVSLGREKEQDKPERTGREIQQDIDSSMFKVRLLDRKIHYLLENDPQHPQLQRYVNEKDAYMGSVSKHVDELGRYLDQSPSPDRGMER